MSPSGSPQVSYSSQHQGYGPDPLQPDRSVVGAAPAGSKVNSAVRLTIGQNRVSFQGPIGPTACRNMLKHKRDNSKPSQGITSNNLSIEHLRGATSSTSRTQEQPSRSDSWRSWERAVLAFSCSSGHLSSRNAAQFCREPHSSTSRQRDVARCKEALETMQAQLAALQGKTQELGVKALKAWTRSTYSAARIQGVESGVAHMCSMQAQPSGRGPYHP